MRRIALMIGLIFATCAHAQDKPTPPKLSDDMKPADAARVLQQMPDGIRESIIAGEHWRRNLIHLFESQVKSLRAQPQTPQTRDQIKEKNETLRLLKSRTSFVPRPLGRKLGIDTVACLGSVEIYQIVDDDEAIVHATTEGGSTIMVWLRGVPTIGKADNLRDNLGSASFWITETKKSGGTTYFVFEPFDASQWCNQAILAAASKVIDQQERAKKK